MSQQPYTTSDDPNLIPPSGANYRLIIAVIACVLIAGAVFSIPGYQAWQKSRAHDAERGKMQGAVYTLDIAGQPVRVELGWAGAHLAVLCDPKLPTGTQVRVGGDFGREALSWNEQYKFYGPTEADVDPYAHTRVKLRFERDGETLWSGKRWAWGVETGHHHH